jgi:hypothetical protein
MGRQDQADRELQVDQELQADHLVVGSQEVGSVHLAVGSQEVGSVHLAVGSQEVGSVHLGWLELDGLHRAPPAPSPPQMAWSLARTRAKEAVVLRSVWQ